MQKDLYKYAKKHDHVLAVLVDETVDHQAAVTELESMGVETSRTSVRRAREKLGVTSPKAHMSSTDRYRGSDYVTDPELIVSERNVVSGKTKKSSDPKTAVFLGDWQVGSHNHALISAAIELIKDLKPDIIGHTGDESDQTVLGRWVRGSEDEYRGNLQEEFDITSGYLEALTEVAPQAERHLAESNHGQRLEKAVAERLPGLGSLRCLKLDKLLRLDELGWELHSEQFEILPGLLMFHGHAEGFSSGTPLKRIEDFMLRKGKSFIFGHTHRFGLHTTAQGYEFDMDTLFAGNPGHMMNLTHADYVRHRSPNWSSGLILVHYDGERLYPETILAKDNILYYNGRIYK